MGCFHGWFPREVSERGSITIPESRRGCGEGDLRARGWPLAIHPAFEHEQEDWMACAEAALTAYLAALAVDGLCLVPKEPTAKMLGRGAIAQFEAEPNMKVEATWTAMIAAASTGDFPTAGTEG